MKYVVNVNLGTTLQMEIEASNEDEAEELAIEEASSILNSNATSLPELQVIDAEVIQKLKKIKYHELTVLNEKLIIKGE